MSARWNNLPHGVESKTYRIRDLDMHVLEAGSSSSPLILLLHGFPELAYSWRKIILPLANAGYRVVAPDQRGYGRTRSISATGSPIQYDDDLSPYRATNLVHDIVALTYGLGHTTVAAVIGHDFGSMVAAYCALIRPDLFKSAVCMSAPFTGAPSLPFDVTKEQGEAVRASPWASLDKYLASNSPPMKHYTTYFCGPTANHDMLNAPQGLHDFLRAYFHVKSGDWPVNDPHPLSSASDLLQIPSYYIMKRDATMPQVVHEHAPSKTEVEQNHWLPDADVDIYVEEFGRTGFQGGLNWYRAVIDEALSDNLSLFSGKKIEVPFMFVGGIKDWGVYQSPGGIEKMKAACTKMTAEDLVLVEGAGHWVQQEQPDEVLSHVLRFLDKTRV